MLIAANGACFITGSILASPLREYPSLKMGVKMETRCRAATYVETGPRGVVGDHLERSPGDFPETPANLHCQLRS